MRCAYIAAAGIQFIAGLIMVSDYLAGRPADAYVWIWAGIGVFFGIADALELAFERRASSWR